jgi:hypothetical protein
MILWNGLTAHFHLFSFLEFRFLVRNNNRRSLAKDTAYCRDSLKRLRAGRLWKMCVARVGWNQSVTRGPLRLWYGRGWFCRRLWHDGGLISAGGGGQFEFGHIRIFPAKVSPDRHRLDNSIALAWLQSRVVKVILGTVGNPFRFGFFLLFRSGHCVFASWGVPAGFT